MAKKRQSNIQSGSAKPSIPSPFVAAPAQLQPFLGALDLERVYIFHVDRTTPAFKRKIFQVPLFLNVGITLLLIWRAFVIIPTYLNLLLIAMGLPSPEAIDTSGKGDEELRWIVLTRAAIVLFDFLLFRFLGFLPFAFFFEQPVSAAMWRWKLGFQNKEVVVRVSKQWGADQFWAHTKSFRGREVTPDNPILRDRILPVIDSTYIFDKTGYMMMGKDYDLDLPAMLDAEQMIKEGEAEYDDFALAVYIYLDGTGWCTWRVEDAPKSNSRKPELDEEEARRRMELFRERVMAMGKENLFYRWIELIQFESQQPGGLTPSRQEELVDKARELFSREGVDFDALFNSVGGIDGFPGLRKDT